MFCPNCGAAEQAQESFCRICGLFLPDLTKLEPREAPISQNIRVNSFFSFATALISLILATLLYATVIGAGTPFVITVVAAFLVVIFVWQSLAFVRTLKLKRQVEELVPKRENSSEELSVPRITNRLLTSPDPSNVVQFETKRDLVRERSAD